MNLRIKINLPIEMVSYIDDLPGNNRSEKVAMLVEDFRRRDNEDKRQRYGDWSSPTATSIEPPSPNAELLTAAKNALEWFSAYDEIEHAPVEPEAGKPLKCDEIITQLDSAIAAADPDWVC